MAGIFLPGSSKGASGDITGVTAGVGLSGGGDSGDLTVTLDLSELSTVTPINGDFFATLDSDGATEQKTTTTALATLFAGDGLTASSAVLAVNVDDSTIETNSDAIRIKDDGVTYAKIQNVSATNRILGRDSSGAGVIEEISPSSLLTMLGVETAATADQTAGEILTLVEDGIDSVHYKDGSIDLAHMSSESVDEDNLHISNSGSNGQFLSKQSGNSGGLTWATPASSATAADDIADGDGAVNILTTSGNITIDAQANDADVIIKVDDAGASVTAVTFDGSAEGDALFVNNINVPGEVMTTKVSFTDGDDAMTIVDGGGVTFPVSIDITGSTGIILENDETITNSTNGTISFSGGIAIPDTGNIGSASDLDAIAIAANGVVNFTQAPTVASAAIKTAGTEDMWIPAGSMRPTDTAGCATLTEVETTATRPDMQVLDFDSSTQEYAQFSVAMPKSWNEGTVTAQFYWTHATAVSTDVIWAIQGVCVSDNDTIDVAYGTAQTVTDTFHNTAEDLAITAATSAITLAGTPAAGDLAFFQVYRDADAGGDTTNSTDARLVGVKINYTTNAATDA